MSVLTNIAGIPLFSTIQEATSWAAANNCSGYHVHNFNRQTGFMGCANHLQASSTPLNSNTPPPPRANPAVNRPQANPVVNRSSGTRTSGGGGGY